MANYRNSALRHAVEAARAAADPSRLRILAALAGRGELCVCQITEILGLAPSTVSKHLGVLYQVRLVESRREGRWVFFSLPEPAQRDPHVAATLDWVQATLEGDEQVARDHAALEAILEKGLEATCLTPKEN